jgi:hypothetical protein
MALSDWFCVQIKVECQSMVTTDANGMQRRVYSGVTSVIKSNIARTTAGGWGNLNDLITSINDKYDELKV